MYCIPVESDVNGPHFVTYMTYVTTEFTFEWPLLVVQPSTATPIANRFNIPLCMHLKNHKVLCVHIFDAIDCEEPVIKVPEKILNQYKLKGDIEALIHEYPIYMERKDLLNLRQTYASFKWDIWK
jgi:hypothetical protein